MQTFQAIYEKPVQQEISFSTYRDDNGAWLVLHLEGRTVRCELTDETARRLGEALIGISAESP